MENQALAVKIKEDFETLLSGMMINSAFKMELTEGLEEILKNRLNLKSENSSGWNGEY